jgi:hypothetical protein
MNVEKRRRVVYVFRDKPAYQDGIKKISDIRKAREKLKRS